MVSNRGCGGLYYPDKGTEETGRTIEHKNKLSLQLHLLDLFQELQERQRWYSDITDRNQSKSFTVGDRLILSGRIKLQTEQSVTAAVRSCYFVKKRLPVSFLLAQTKLFTGSKSIKPWPLGTVLTFNYSSRTWAVYEDAVQCSLKSKMENNLW